ncbi:hypothetical protein FGIG_11720 [Fasciola gigantica]|uniref:Uncharacterized protein n=1 Tax=Fasciola gigantica TaxID=46835 RepID=A0A504XZJ4_FASGI|nr:hypothetical protein FGIG_11720 [Fasciola gigantica]
MNCLGFIRCFVLYAVIPSAVVCSCCLRDPEPCKCVGRLYLGMLYRTCDMKVSLMALRLTILPKFTSYFLSVDDQVPLMNDYYTLVSFITFYPAPIVNGTIQILLVSLQINIPTERLITGVVNDLMANFEWEETTPPLYQLRSSKFDELQTGYAKQTLMLNLFLVAQKQRKSAVDYLKKISGNETTIKTYAELEELLQTDQAVATMRLRIIREQGGISERFDADELDHFKNVIQEHVHLKDPLSNSSGHGSSANEHSGENV